MSSLDTWMPLYIGDYQRDTADLTLEQSGAYLHLLMRYWISGPLPDDDGRLAAILRVSRTHFVRHIGPALRPYFHPLDGRLHQGRADTEREKRAKIAEKRAENGRKTSEKPAKNAEKLATELKDINELMSASATVLQQQMPPTSTSTDTEKKERAVLRTGAFAPGEAIQGEILAPATKPLPARDRLWGEGLKLVADLTGKSTNQCRGLVGRWLRTCRNDCARLLAILDDAAMQRPIDPVSWIEAALSARSRRISHNEQVAAELGIDLYGPGGLVLDFPTERRAFG